MTQEFRVTNETKGTVLAERSERASDPVRRGIGLMGRRALPDSGGLIIVPCNGIVTFFMRFPIDVLFVDGDGAVCHLIESIVPWRTSRIVRSSKMVVELPAGTIGRTGTTLGDKLRIEPA